MPSQTQLSRCYLNITTAVGEHVTQSQMCKYNPFKRRVLLPNRSEGGFHI